MRGSEARFLIYCEQEGALVALRNCAQNDRSRKGMPFRLQRNFLESPSTEAGLQRQGYVLSSPRHLDLGNATLLERRALTFR